MAPSSSAKSKRTRRGMILTLTGSDEALQLASPADDPLSVPRSKLI